MPRRCAINSSGRTVVLVSISTMSIATNEMSKGTQFLHDQWHTPTVGMSAITTLRNEFANLISECQSERIDDTGEDVRKVDIFQDEVDAVLFEVTYADSGLQFLVDLHCNLSLLSLRRTNSIQTTFCSKFGDRTCQNF